MKDPKIVWLSKNEKHRVVGFSDNSSCIYEKLTKDSLGKDSWIRGDPKLEHVMIIYGLTCELYEIKHGGGSVKDSNRNYVCYNDSSKMSQNPTEA